MNDQELHGLIGQAFSLKTKIDAEKAELKDLNDQITAYIEANKMIAPTKSSCAVQSSGGVTAKIARKDTYKWDQNKLNIARYQMGDDRFSQIFGYEWKQLSKKLIDEFLAHAPTAERDLVNDALTITRSYSVSYSQKEDA